MTILYVSNVSDSTTCLANLVTDDCKIQAATVDYPVVIANNTVTLDYGKLSDMAVASPYISTGDSYPYSDNGTLAPDGSPAGPLMGLQETIYSYLSSNAAFHGMNATPPLRYTSSGIQPMLYLNRDDGGCLVSWDRPTSALIASLHEATFRMALNAASTLSATSQPFTAQRKSEVLVFRSSFGYLGAALGVMSLSVLALAALLWGWWELGRSVSGSPLEIAIAFGAPMLECSHEMGAEGIVREVGGKRVKYENTVVGGVQGPMRLIELRPEETVLLGDGR